MQPLYDPKALSDSLELDYVQRPRQVHRWMRLFTWGAGLAAVLYAGWTILPANHDQLQAGPLSTPHAMFNQDCGKCHTVAFATAARLVPSGHGMVSAPDPACLQCHPKLDHNSAVPAVDCTSCHKEHRGDVLLARTSDLHCTECHARFKNTYSDHPFEIVASIATHPEFALWRAKEAVDPGNVEFNHAFHLDLREEDSRVINKPAVRQLQQLQCAYCHQEQTSGGSRWEAESGKWPAGRGNYMKPIEFDRHCQQCHRLQLPLKLLSDDIPDVLKTPVRAFQKAPVMHPAKGQTASMVRAATRERYLKFAQENAGVLKLPSMPFEDWQVLPGLQRRGEPATQGQMDWVNDQWKQAEALFFDKTGGCAHCHAGSAKKERGADGLPDFGQPRIPRRWFEHAIFDHQAHRLLQCTACHEGATTSENRKDVLMPKLASCQACHQARTGFARADCLECHQFHHHDGSEAWQGKMKIEDCKR